MSGAPLPARESARFAAGPLLYAAGLLLLAKLARALELSLRLDSPRPFALLPAVLGQDLVLWAALALGALALARLPRGPRWICSVLLLLPLALLLPADVIAHALTGQPLTLRRLRGEEGATLADLDLLEFGDLLAGGLGIGLALAALWPALAFGPRVGWARRLAHARPLAIAFALGCALSLLQGALLPHTQGLSEQPVFALLASLGERSGLPGVSLSEQRFRALAKPALPVAAEPAPPRQGSPPRNVVIFLAEGVPWKATGFDPRLARERNEDGSPLPNPTPNLVRRAARDGLVFDRYYANWHASIQALFSIVCSAFPPPSGDIVRRKPRIDCGELSEELAAQNVRAGLFHAGRFSFYNKLALLGRRRYAVELDAEELAKTSVRQSHAWGIDDRAMVEGALAWVDGLPRDQPFGALLIGISAHYPYWTPRDFRGPFPGTNRRPRFYQSVAFQDHVFEQLLRGFEQRGLYDDTLFVWLGDHGHYMYEPERITPGVRLFYEPNLHTPLVLINPRLFPRTLAPEARHSERLGSHVDLLPTLLDALGLPQDPRHSGQSLLGSDYRPRRMYFGAENGRYIGFIEGQFKFVVDTRTQRTEYYDLQSDPDELQDLSPRFADRMRRYTEDALLFAGAAQGRIDDAKVLQERVSVNDVYRLFLDHVQVNQLQGGQRRPCGTGASAACPELGAVLHERTARLQGERRRCVMLALPAAGQLELAVAHPDALALLTGTIVALPERAPDDLRVDIQAIVDGEPQPKLRLSNAGAQRPRHPRAARELRYVLERSRGDAGAKVEVCLQLNTTDPPR